MLSVIANHCYSWNMGFILWKNAEGNALEPWPQMFWTNQVNCSHGLRQRRVVRGRRTSCVCWKEEEWVEHLPSTPSKNPEQRKNKKNLHTKTEWERGAAGWSLIKLRFDGRKQARTRRAADERKQNTWTRTQPLSRLVLLSWEVKVKLS